MKRILGERNLERDIGRRFVETGICMIVIMTGALWSAEPINSLSCAVFSSEPYFP